MELQALTLKELFPPNPISENPLTDVGTRMINLPIYYRKKLCEETGWNLPQYYRKLGAGTIQVNCFKPALEEQEREQVITITINVLKMFLEYMQSVYKRPY